MTPVWNYDGTPTDHSLLFFVLESEPDILYTGFTVDGHFYHISEMGRVPLLKGSKVKAWRYASKEDFPGTPAETVADNKDTHPKPSVPVQSEEALAEIRELLDKLKVSLVVHCGQGTIYVVPENCLICPERDIPDGSTVVTSRIATIETRSFGSGYCIVTESSRK